MDGSSASLTADVRGPCCSFRDEPRSSSLTGDEEGADDAAASAADDAAASAADDAAASAADARSLSAALSLAHFGLKRPGPNRHGPVHDVARDGVPPSPAEALLVLAAVGANAIRLHAPAEVEGGPEEVAWALYPCAAMLNHSCAPNAAWAFDPDGTMRVTSLGATMLHSTVTSLSAGRPDSPAGATPGLSAAASAANKLGSSAAAGLPGSDPGGLADDAVGPAASSLAVEGPVMKGMLEVCVSYLPLHLLLPQDERGRGRRRAALAAFGFACACDRCASEARSPEASPNEGSKGGRGSGHGTKKRARRAI
jgi:hypothetical protein